jgi:hypothetical protein
MKQLAESRECRCLGSRKHHLCYKPDGRVSGQACEVFWFPFGRRHASRNDRLQEKEDDVDFTWRSGVHGMADAQPGKPPP